MSYFYIDKDSKDFLEESKIEQLLKKYCKFLLLKLLSEKRRNGKTVKWLKQVRIK